MAFRRDFRIVGADALKELGRELKRTGDKEMFKRTQKVLADATKPAKEEVPRFARAYLPKGGGLAERVANLKIVAKVRVSGRYPGVRLTGSATGVAASRFTKARQADIRKIRKRQKAWTEAKRSNSKSFAARQQAAPKKRRRRG